MKRLLYYFFLSLVGLNYAQTNEIVFELRDEFDTYSTQNCLTNNLPDESLVLDFTKGSKDQLQKFALDLVVSESQVFDFQNFDQFNNTQLLSLLNSNNVFDKVNSIKLVISWTLTSGKEESQEIEVCILKNEEKLKLAQSRNSNTKDYIKIPVSFVTDRKDTYNTDLYNRFNGDRSDLQYGRMVVTIPYTHTLGEIERPSYWRLEFSDDTSKHITIQSLRKQNKDDFFKHMRNRISANGSSTFLFIHGYNVSFADAAMRTAQITFDLRYNGEPVFYSWPSQGATTKYTVDEANIEWSKYNMKNFLFDYLTKTNAKNIYLVAHSMGNRGLTTALIDLMNEHPELKNKITEIILAAPDIDADVFKRDLAPKLVSKIGKPITLYVSADDLALIASQKVHGNNRAGFAGDNIVVVNGIETIDASGIDSSLLSHSYFATSSNLIKDIFDLMKSGKRATDRETLEKVSKANVTYWKVKKGQN